MGLAAGDEAVMDAACLAVLEPDLAAMPAGLDTLVGPRGTRLSGGQVQRVAAARAVVRRPELLVFDDLSAASTWRRSERCGSGSARAGTSRASSPPTAGRCWSRPTG